MKIETIEDPIMQEVRAAREELLRKAGGTLDGLVNMLVESQKLHADKLVNFANCKSEKSRTPGATNN